LSSSTARRVLGCPVISACAGVDLGLVVTEPGLAGLHDLERALRTLSHFKVPALCASTRRICHQKGPAPSLLLLHSMG
jgi:MinD superfamily P-loop ATPase